MFKKKYKTTSKITYAFLKQTAMSRLAEEYVKRDNHDRAVRAFRDAEALGNAAWDLVYDLYPSLKGKGISYKQSLKEILLLKDAKG